MAVGSGAGMGVAVGIGVAVEVGTAVAAGKKTGVREAVAELPEKTPAANSPPSIPPLIKTIASNHFQLAPRTITATSNHHLIPVHLSPPGHSEKLAGIVRGHPAVSVHIHDQVFLEQSNKHLQGDECIYRGDLPVPVAVSGHRHLDR